MTDHSEIEPEMNNLADAGEKEAVNMNGSEMERKRAQLQRAGTMDATAWVILFTKTYFMKYNV